MTDRERLDGEIWEERDGQVYVDIGRLLASLGLPDTAENREQAIAGARAAWARRFPGAEVVVIRVPVKRPPASGGTAP